MFVQSIEPGLAVLTLSPVECRRLALACNPPLDEPAPETAAWLEAATAAFQAAGAAALALTHIRLPDLPAYHQDLADLH